KRGVLGDSLLERGDLLARAIIQGTGAQVEIVCFDAGFVPTPPAPELEAQAVDDSARNLLLNEEDVGQLPVVFSRPQREVVTHANKLGVNPQLPAGAQDRALHNVVRCKLSSGVTRLLRLSLEGKR